MQISLNSASLQNWTGNVLLVGLLEGNLEEQLSHLEKLCDGLLIKRLEKQEFSAKPGDFASFNFLKGNPEKLILIGLGKPQNLQLDDLRVGVSKGIRSGVEDKGSLGILFPWEPFDASAAAKAIGESARLSLFKDLRFRSEPDPQPMPEKIELIGFPESANFALDEIHPICSGVELARELVGAPPNSLTPIVLAEKALLLAEEYDLHAKVLELKDCEKKGMGAYLAVAKGSDLLPKFIHLTYKPKGEVIRRIALVGKGLTFDSGGYNLKVGASQIDLMKFDMGGSAAVIGAARAIGEMRPEGTEVHFIIAACENMINGSAVHPGDIIQASNGKTIEINNTDAEGRLTLADALVYACELNPDAIVDLATLTGACVIALGDEIAGLWTESDQLANDLKVASDSAGEGLWRMPLPNSYREGLKSMLADIKNTGPRQGGSITAALFLKEFVKDSIQWAHIDIAGTVWSEKDRGVNSAGATGYGVRTLVNWINSLSI